jgi:tetratricopeptide (TPR) repeat protein
MLALAGLFTALPVQGQDRVSSSSPLFQSGTPADAQVRANQLIQQGQFQDAIRVLEGLSFRPGDPTPLLQMLDLQVRLRDETGARRSLDSLEARLPADGRLRSPADFRVCGAMAGAWYRLGQPARADEWWKRVRNQVRDEETALTVFHAYRQVRLVDESLDWARQQRKRWSQPTLWALEVASLHEEGGQWKAAVDELSAWQCAQDGSSNLVETRLLKLVESTRDKRDLTDHMLRRVRENAGCPGLGQAVLGVLAQQGEVESATRLAWQLDPRGEAGIPFELARDLARDGRTPAALALLDEMAARGVPQAVQLEGRLLRAESLVALGRADEALALYRQLAEGGEARAREARLHAARLLHRPLGRPAEAIGELEQLLRRQPGHAEGGRLLTLLLAHQGEDERAQAQLRQLQERARVNEQERADLGFLSLRLDWWAGRLTPCAQGLGEYLKTSTRQDTFNDAIELADLLAFTTSDSLAVAEAARADRLAFGGAWREAVALLHGLAESRTGKLAEWLEWRACQLVAAEADGPALRGELARFRERQPASLRLDRLAWMDLLATEKEGAPREELRRQALALLETWPTSLLQDAVRRRLREWEGGEAAPVEGPVDTPQDERPR